MVSGMNKSKSQRGYAMALVLLLLLLISVFGARKLLMTKESVRKGHDQLRLTQGGRHNLQNALAAVAVGLDVGIPFADIARGLAASQGVGRRLESHGEHGGVLVNPYDD